MSPVYALRNTYGELLHRYGEQAEPEVWWPLTHPTNPKEWVRVVHAALSLNSRWAQIVKGTESLARDGCLQAAAIDQTPLEQLASLIAGGLPAQKARRLKEICGLVRRFGSEAAFLEQVTRADLLSLPWIREETADRILLYACRRPVFPVDRHVRLVFSEHRLLPHPAQDEDIKALVQEAFEDDLAVYLWLYAACQIESARLVAQRRTKGS